jgi:hypothetical protein
MRALAHEVKLLERTALVLKEEPRHLPLYMSEHSENKLETRRGPNPAELRNMTGMTWLTRHD